MQRFFLLFAAMLSLGLLGSSVAHAGATAHLRAAIKLNKARAPLYSVLTDRRSDAISRRMIQKELLTLPGAVLLDLLAKPYQAAGIPIARAEFVGMSDVPKFSSEYSFTPEALQDFHAIDLGRLQSQLKKASKAKDFAVVVEIAEDELQALSAPRAYHCMTRHILESIARAANLAPVHAAKAREQGLPSSAWLSWMMVRTQINLLEYASSVDRDLAPIQARNIPMLCQDVPPIPLE